MDINTGIVVNLDDSMRRYADAIERTIAAAAVDEMSDMVKSTPKPAQPWGRTNRRGPKWAKR